MPERPRHIEVAVNAYYGGHAITGLLMEADLQYVSEDDLQQAIKEHLDKLEVYPTREVRLSDGHSRIDLLAGATGIEVKIEGSWANVIRQLTRYAKCPEIASLVLVTTRVKHHKVPAQLCGKPINLLSLVGVHL